MKVFIVVDLGFGDAGKGLLTDWLVRRHRAGLVVRFNGGAQAGHNVVTPDGRHHTFAQLGAGSFVDGVRTLLSRHVLVHPTALLREADHLAARGVEAPLQRLAISRRARVVTPFHQAAGRLRELARRGARHGSCGVGIGETVAHALGHPGEVIRAADLAERRSLERRLEPVRARMRRVADALSPALPDTPAVRAELEILHRDGVAETWCAAAEEVAAAVTLGGDRTLAAWTAGAGCVVFEGAQGVLLDQGYGFHPHTTWSDCTFRNAEEVVERLAGGAEVVRLGVLRSHAVRHGAGPLPTETPELDAAVREHNREGPWQGPVRYGWFDAVLARYALECAGPLDALALTHLDAPPRRAPEPWRLAMGYRLPEGVEGRGLEETGPGSDGGSTVRLAPLPGRDLRRRARLTRLLAAARPVLRECAPDGAAVRRAVEEAVGRPVDVVATGPRATDVEIVDLKSDVFARTN